MRVGKVKLYKSFYWNNKEVYKFKLGCKWYGMYKGRPEFDLLDGMNIRRRQSPYRGVLALL